jgi:hypothetical protein
LVEGNSIRSTERMVDAHRDTIMRLTFLVAIFFARFRPYPLLPTQSKE